MSRLTPLFLTAGEHKRTIDYHIHSDYNEDATGTIKEYMSSAIKKGLTSIAITNHVWKTSSWVENFIKETKMHRSEYGYHLLIGFEARVINIDGEVDILPRYMKDTELLLGTLHNLPTHDDYVWLDSKSLVPRKIAEIIREVTLNLISRNQVNVIAHPLALYYEKYEISFPDVFLDEIAQAAAKRGTALEIYNSKHPMPKDTLGKLINLCIEYEVPMSVGSDAHNPSEIGSINYEEIQAAIEIGVRRREGS